MQTQFRIERSMARELEHFLLALRVPKLHFILGGLPMPVWLQKNRIDTPIKIKNIRNLKEASLYAIAVITFLYHRYWLSKDLKHIAHWLRREKEAIQKLIEYVPLATTYPWNKAEVCAYPVIGKWAATRQGALLFGVRPHAYLTLSIVLHELIHANTHEHLKTDIESGLTEELATVLMTRKIETEFLHLSTAALQQSPVELSALGVDDAALERLDAAVAHTESFKNIYAYAADALQGRH